MSSFRFYCIIAMVFLASAAAVASTHRVLTQTWDEPAHVARGMQWLDQGTYTYFPEHPPLGPVLFAVGPYLKGIRSFDLPERYDEGREILHHADNYAANLAAARAGNLLFLFVAMVVAAVWSYRLWGSVAGISTAVLLGTLPPFIAHAGLATTDLPGASAFVLACFAFWKWIERPSYGRAGLVGIAVGLALLGKLSNLAFIPVSFALLLGAAFFHRGLVAALPARLLGLGLGIVACGLVLWGGYHFSTGTLEFPDWGYGTPRGLQRIYRATLSGLWLPAPAFFYGIDVLLAHNRGGHLTYFMGEAVYKAPWYYFPVALLINTPLPFLLLSIAGFTALVSRSTSRRVSIAELAPILVAAGVLLVAMPSGINIGTRHILPVYVMLAIVAGYGASALWNATLRVKPLGSLVAGSLLGWHVATFLVAHPDHLAYYNVLGGSEPHEIVFGTTDWGQDLGRLVTHLRDMDIDHLHVCLRGSADLTRFDLPPHTPLLPYEPLQGWVAINLLCEKFGTWRAPYDQFAWLEVHRAHDIIGKTIKLYYIPSD